jgi:hypothetical protein
MSFTILPNPNLEVKTFSYPLSAGALSPPNQNLLSIEESPTRKQQALAASDLKILWALVK